MILKHVGFIVLCFGFGFVVLGPLLPGCTLLGPTDTQLAACAKLLDGQLLAGTISKGIAETYSAQMHAVPPSLPQPCVGKV